MRQREVVAGLGAAAVWPLRALAQQPERLRRMGILWPSSPLASELWLRAFRAGLEELGYAEGRNVVIEQRGATTPEALAALARELVGARVEVIVTAGTSPTRAARDVAASIPTVMTFVSEPIEAGFVASLAHPRGNITGLTSLGPEISTKWLELLREIAPTAFAGGGSA